MQSESTQTGVYCWNALQPFTTLQGNTTPHAWMIYLYFSAVYLHTKYDYNC